MKTYPDNKSQILTLKNMEHVLCEFSKYHKIKVNNGKANKYDGVNGAKSKMDWRNKCGSCKKKPLPVGAVDVYRGTQSEFRICATCLDSFCADCEPKSSPAFVGWTCKKCTSAREMKNTAD